MKEAHFHTEKTEEINHQQTHINRISFQAEGQNPKGKFRDAGRNEDQ